MMLYLHVPRGFLAKDFGLVGLLQRGCFFFKDLEF